MHQLLFDTSEILRQQGVRYAVLCPGSRNAPLLVSFGRNANVKKFSVVDERSAAYIALGIARETASPTVVCCTSGTALLNFGPAAAEAYYQGVPLILLSADRPPEWIDQNDGQTIRQSKALQHHVKASFDLPPDLDNDDSQWHYERKLREAVMLAMEGAKGPVHVNVPVREPFYPTRKQEMVFSGHLSPRVVIKPPSIPDSQTAFEGLREGWSGFGRKIMVAGWGGMTDDEGAALLAFSESQKIPLLTEVTSNCFCGGVITQSDLITSCKAILPHLYPDLIISFGGSLLSKNLRCFLRGSPAAHWQMHRESPTVTDSFRKHSTIIHGDIRDFVSFFNRMKPSNDAAYFEKWKRCDEEIKGILAEHPAKKLSLLYCWQKVLEALPQNLNVHLANSMSVRYANFYQHLLHRKHATVYCNRGTSGIDGTNSVAVGVSLVSEKQNILLSGDLSLLYDRNAFLHNHSVSNLKIVVFNDQAGGIFDLVAGSQFVNSDDKETYLKTHHHRNFGLFAWENGMEYFFSDTQKTLPSIINQFFKHKGRGLLEILTKAKINLSQFRRIKETVRQALTQGD